MLLRASGELAGRKIDLHALMDASRAAESGVEHGEELIHFADAVVAGSDEEISRAREALLAEVGPQGVVDAAAVIGNFQRMVRIADSTGIPLDSPLAAMSQGLSSELDLEGFASRASTPRPGPAQSR